MTITAIKTAISNLTPTWDSDISINVRGYDSDNPILPTLSEAECPMRMIGMPDDKNRSQLDFIAMGKASNRMTWEILDRLYMFPVNLDMGIENYGIQIDLYKESYNTAVLNSRNLGTTNAKVEQVTYDGPYIRNFPDVPGATAFWVVDALVTVEEFV